MINIDHFDFLQFEELQDMQVADVVEFFTDPKFSNWRQLYHLMLPVINNIGPGNNDYVTLCQAYAHASHIMLLRSIGKDPVQVVH